MESLIFLNKLVKKKSKHRSKIVHTDIEQNAPSPPHPLPFPRLLTAANSQRFYHCIVTPITWPIASQCWRGWRDGKILKTLEQKKIINTLNLLWRVMVLVLLVCLVLWITSILAFLVNIYVVLTLVLSNKESILLTISITWTGNVNNDYHQESKTYRKSNSFCPIISMYVK